MLNRETMERTLALLTAYANSGVSNETSLECAQVCGVLREELARPATYQRGDLVRKKGSKGQWHGRVCGAYSTDITPEGYAVESLLEKGSVQIYPASALERWDGETR